MGEKIVDTDETIASFEFAFMALFAIGLITTTNYVVAEYPIAGIMLILCAGLLLLLAKVVRHKKGIPKGGSRV